MPVYFFDSSAIMKRYYYEVGANWVRTVCENRIRSEVYLSQLAEVEVVASLRRAGRRNHDHIALIDSSVNMFVRHIGRRVYSIVSVDTQITRIAQDLCNQFWDVQPHPLRSMDAIQVASALLVAAVHASQAPNELLFVSSDRRQLAVARELGFNVVNPEYA